jgi:hypothetical protein
MSLQSFQETLVSQDVQGTLFNTYTTAKTVIDQAALYQFRPNDLKIGKTLRISVLGGISNIVTTPGTVTLQVMLGSIVVFTTGAIQLNATAHTLLPFWLDILMTVRSKGTGTNAKFIGMAQLSGLPFTRTAAQVDDANTPGMFPAPATAPAVGTGFDSTIANILDFWAGFSISNSGNGIQVEQYVVEALN